MSSPKPTASTEDSGRIKQEAAAATKAESTTSNGSESKMNDEKSGEDRDGGIIVPHDHDVLSGRGNSVNHHPGNEYFRSLVRHHKLAYVRCPKPQKEQFSKLIVSTVRDREPPGRFLKQNSGTKLWYNIGTQKALDKTRQALREGAPATVAGLMLSQGLTPSHAAAAGLTPSQAVSTLSGVSGENEMIGNPPATTNGGNPFLAHPAHAHAAAVASQQQQQHLAAAAHSGMVNRSYYHAAAAAAVGAGMTNYPNSPKPPSASKEVTEAPSASAPKGGQPPPQSPQTNPRLPPSSTAGAPSYPPPPANSDEAMKYHAAQVVRMAAAHPAAGNGSSNNSSASGNFGSSASLAAAAGTFNPVLLEHIMAQHRGGSVPPPSDWNSGRPSAPAAGGRNEYYAGYPPAPGGAPQHEDTHGKSQRQEAYISHLQERIQQQERQLLTLCSHILLSPPAPPPPGGGGSMGVNPSPPTSSLSSGNPSAPASSASASPLHNGISHPQYAAAAKMNAAAAVANINATAAAVKEIQSYANPGDRSRLAITAPSPFAGLATPSSAAASAAAAAPKPAKAGATTTPTNGTAAVKEEAAVTSSTGAAKSPAPTPEKSSDDGDAIAALLSLGIGKSPTSSSPTNSAAGAVPAATSESDDSISKKKRTSASGRRTLPLKKKQIQQENSAKAAAHTAAANTFHQQALAQQQQAQQQAQQQQHLHHVASQQQAPPPRQQPPKALSINPMMMPNQRAVIPKPPVDMGQAPELYLYGETPIHDPHVHVSIEQISFLFSSMCDSKIFFLLPVSPQVQNLTLSLQFLIRFPISKTGCIVWPRGFDERTPGQRVVPSFGPQQSPALQELSKTHETPRGQGHCTGCAANPAKSPRTIFGKDQDCRWFHEQLLDTNYLQERRRKGITGVARKGYTQLGSPTVEFSSFQSTRSRESCGLFGKRISFWRRIWRNKFVGPDHGRGAIGRFGLIIRKGNRG